MNYGIGNVKGGNAIPHITIELSQMIGSYTAQLTNEQYDLINKNSACYISLPNDDELLFTKINSSLIEGLGKIALSAYIPDLPEDKFATFYIVAIDKTTKSATIQTDIIGAKANPTLAGTESDLEGIEIGGVKYKVGGGGGGSQLYKHNISLHGRDFDNQYYDITFTIINSVNSAYASVAPIFTYLGDKGFDSQYKKLEASGTATSSNYVVKGITKATSYIAIWHSSGNVGVDTNKVSDFNDIVETL